MRKASEIARAVLDKHWLDNVAGLARTDLQAEIAQAILAARREALEAVRKYHKNMAAVCRKDMAKSRHPEVTDRLATLAHCHEQSEASIDGFEIG
jgi:hypothetical protein